jgi:hypothetical protein
MIAEKHSPQNNACHSVNQCVHPVYVVSVKQLLYDLEARALETRYRQFVAHAPVSSRLPGLIHTRMNGNVLITRCLKPKLVDVSVDRDRLMPAAF